MSYRLCQWGFEFTTAAADVTVLAATVSILLLILLLLPLSLWGDCYNFLFSCCRCRCWRYCRSCSSAAVAAAAARRRMSCHPAVCFLCRRAGHPLLFTRKEGPFFSSNIQFFIMFILMENSLGKWAVTIFLSEIANAIRCPIVCVMLMLCVCVSLASETMGQLLVFAV